MDLNLWRHAEAEDEREQIVFNSGGGDVRQIEHRLRQWVRQDLPDQPNSRERQVIEGDVEERKLVVNPPFQSRRRPAFDLGEAIRDFRFENRDGLIESLRTREILSVVQRSRRRERQGASRRFFLPRWLRCTPAASALRLT